MSHAFWGPSFSDAELSALLLERAALVEAEGCHMQVMADEKELVETAARAIADCPIHVAGDTHPPRAPRANTGCDPH
jgi:hypothetical protein